MYVSSEVFPSTCCDTQNLCKFKNKLPPSIFWDLSRLSTPVDGFNGHKTMKILHITWKVTEERNSRLCKTAIIFKVNFHYTHTSMSMYQREETFLPHWDFENHFGTNTSLIYCIWKWRNSVIQDSFSNEARITWGKTLKWHIALLSDE